MSDENTTLTELVKRVWALLLLLEEARDQLRESGTARDLVERIDEFLRLPLEPKVEIHSRLTAALDASHARRARRSMLRIYRLLNAGLVDQAQNWLRDEFNALSEAAGDPFRLE